MINNDFSPPENYGDRFDLPLGNMIIDHNG